MENLTTVKFGILKLAQLNDEDLIFPRPWVHLNLIQDEHESSDDRTPFKLYNIAAGKSMDFLMVFTRKLWGIYQETCGFSIPDDKKTSLETNSEFTAEILNDLYINDWSGVYFEIKIGVSAFRASFQGLTDCKEYKSW